MAKSEFELFPEPEIWTPKVASAMDAWSLELTSKLDSEKERGEERWDHSHNNWMSEIHHPCLKFLVHCRRDWRQRQLIDIDGIWRVNEGIEQEWKAIKLLGDIGYIVDKSQRKVKLEKYKITGKIDGVIAIPDRVREMLPEPMREMQKFPIEIKTVNPNYWNTTRTIDELKKHPKFWINKIPSQLNLYLFGMRLPGGFLLILTFGKRPRILPMLYDPALAEYDCLRATQVNKHVEAGTYPEPIPYDPTLFSMCDFNHICKPIKTTAVSEINEGEEPVLEHYLDLKEQKHQFDALHKELIGSMDKPGRYHGKDGFINEIEIKTTKSIRKKIKGMPKELKESYEEEYTLVQTSIDRITK